jgi:hypothetical protein
MRLPSEFYAHHALKFDRQSVLPEDELRALIGGHGFSIANLAHRLSDDGNTFEYRMIIRSRDRRKRKRFRSTCAACRRSGSSGYLPRAIRRRPVNWSRMFR